MSASLHFVRVTNRMSIASILLLGSVSFIGSSKVLLARFSSESEGVSTHVLMSCLSLLLLTQGSSL